MSSVLQSKACSNSIHLIFDSYDLETASFQRNFLRQTKASNGFKKEEEVKQNCFFLNFFLIPPPREQTFENLVE